jgi:hypothetical protein
VAGTAGKKAVLSYKKNQKLLLRSMGGRGDRGCEALGNGVEHPKRKEIANARRTGQ